MSLHLKLASSIAAAVLAMTVAPAMATTITFSSLTNGTSYTEAGMRMTAPSGVFNYPSAGQAHMDSGVATFNLVSLADFSLTSFDYLIAGGTGTARFSAYNNGILLGSTDFSGANGVRTFSSLFSNIDEFRITYVNTHFTFDNINFQVAAVPEPTVLSLFALGLAGMGVVGRRRAIKSRQAA